MAKNGKHIQISLYASGFIFLKFFPRFSVVPSGPRMDSARTSSTPSKHASIFVQSVLDFVDERKYLMKLKKKMCLKFK